METVSGRVTLPDALSNYTSVEYVCSHGITPGRITVTAAANDDDEVVLDLTGTGDLDFTDGNDDFTLPNCIATGQKRYDGTGGRFWQINMLDRRWAWKDTFIDGQYNVRDNYGHIVPSTYSDVPTLATLCLKAMGEKDGSWDISALPTQLPDTAYPSVNWVGANPAQALESLATQFGCRVAYQPVADRVVLVKPGEGADLPAGTYTSTAPAKTRPPLPETLRFVGAPAILPGFLILEPVGEDFDGRVRRINELSYKPQAGWETFPHPSPNGFGLVVPPKWVARGKTRYDALALANKSLYKWFRPTFVPLRGENTFHIPFLWMFKQFDGKPPELIDVDQLVLLDRVYTPFRDDQGLLVTRGPRCYGVVVKGGGAFNAMLGADNQGPDRPILQGFSVDTARGIVVFGQIMSSLNLQRAAVDVGLGALAGVAADVQKNLPRQLLPGQKGAAQIVIACSLCVLDLMTRQPIRYTLDRPVPNGQPGTVRIVRRDDVQYVCFAEYDARRKRIDLDSLKDNRDDCEKAANSYLDAIPLDDIEAETRVYPRLVPVDPDGAIQQVTYQCGGAVSTTVSRNTEHVAWLQPYEFRRDREAGRHLAQALDVAGAVGGGIAGALPAAARIADAVP